MSARGFTLIELMSAMLILALLALMSLRGLSAVLDARDRLRQETRKWNAVAAFFSRFDRDLHLSSPRPFSGDGARLEFSRFASADGVDAPRRLAYRLGDAHAIEVLVWAPDSPAPALPARYAALAGVAALEMQYLDSRLAWRDAWPPPTADAALPRALRLRLVLDSGEVLERSFALQ